MQTVKQLWESYAAAVLPREVIPSDVQYVETRRAWKEWLS